MDSIKKSTIAAVVFCTGVAVLTHVLSNRHVAADTSYASMVDGVDVYFKLRAVDDYNNDDMAKTKLDHAQKVASQLYEAVEKNNLIVAGKTESKLNEEVTKLALDQFGIERHWHKKIVRAGANTLAIYPDNPPDRVIQKDDIVILDFGGVVDGYEFDYARTYVLGNDARKLKIKHDAEKAWYETQSWILKQKKLPASDLFKYTREKAKEYGWTSAGEIAGHIVGKFPHEQPPNPKSLELDVHPDNQDDIFLLDRNGLKRHWILEMHFVDKANNIGGYFEQLI